MKTKIKPPKMTEQQKLEQNRGSRFIRVCPAHDYGNPNNPFHAKREWDELGRRVR